MVLLLPSCCSLSSPVRVRLGGSAAGPAANLLQMQSSVALRSRKRVGFRAEAFFFNPAQERILKEAIKEPVAFVGGIFAGILRLDLNEDPLKEWVTRTVEAAGITVEEIDAEDVQSEETPQQIEIE